jgi:DNA helicase II / ATP-dependent DNA helicase PcrA
VFVDEVQDTNADQERLLRTLFGEGCVYVRLGDENQAIFADQDSDDGTPSLFNARTVLPISSSLRFGTQIAAFASPLTVARPQSLVGRTDRASKPHSVFLFDRASIAKVVPTFGDVVLRGCTAEELKSGKVKLVGLRKSASVGAVRDHFPFCLRDYWDGFISDIASLSSSPKSLLGYVMEARRFAGANVSAKLAFDSLMQGILGFLHRQGTLTPDGKRWSRAALYRALQDDPPDTLLEFQDLLRQFCLGTASFSEPEWKQILIALLGCLKCLKLGPGTQEAKDCFAYENPRPTSTGMGTPATTVRNTFTHQSMLGSIDIEVGTIHSAKGETHAATLVVETYSRTHDLQKLLPVLTGQASASSLSGTERNHCKCIFVGMTRPAHLLCLAICADHLGNGDAAALQHQGWNIVDLR